MFTTTKKLTAAEARVSELEAEVRTRDLEIVALSGQLAAAEQDLAVAQLEILEARNASGQIATEILAAIGQPMPLDFEGATAAPHDHLAVMEKLTGVARTEYFIKHEAEIRAQMGK